MAQALQFAQDFKLGHYMKIPPRTMFFAQVSAAAIAGTVQLGVQAWMFTNIVDMCSITQPDGFICPSTQVFGTASIIVSFGLAVFVFTQYGLVVGCYWTSASVLPWPNVRRPPLVLPRWRALPLWCMDHFPQVAEQLHSLHQVCLRQSCLRSKTKYDVASL
jgi:hypothetical protein